MVDLYSIIKINVKKYTGRQDFDDTFFFKSVITLDEKESETLVYAVIKRFGHCAEISMGPEYFRILNSRLDALHTALVEAMKPFLFEDVEPCVPEATQEPADEDEAPYCPIEVEIDPILRENEVEESKNQDLECPNRFIEI